MAERAKELQAQIEALQRQLAEAQAQLNVAGDSNVMTDGGAYVGGDVGTEGGDFIGRDKLVLGSVETLRIASAVFQAAPKELLWTYLGALPPEVAGEGEFGPGMKSLDLHSEACGQYVGAQYPRISGESGVLHFASHHFSHSDPKR